MDCELIRLLLSLRLRCHVLETVKPTVSPVKESPLEIGAANSQQELNTVVSSVPLSLFVYSQPTQVYGRWTFSGL